MRARLINLLSKLRPFEPLLFILFAVINILPLFAAQFYPFMDGPAHLYNAKVIHQMIFRHDSFLEQYFMFNPVIVPNWFSHLIMSPLFSFLSPSAVEKVFLSGYYLAFPFAFRYCVRAFNGNKAASYLGFPLAYQNLILFSFYNFSAGLVLLLLAIGFFYRYFISGIPRPKHYLFLFVLVTAVYLCHLVTLMLLLLLMAFLFVWNAMASGERWKTVFSKQAFFIVLATAPSVILLAVYMMKFHAGASEYTFLEDRLLLEYITHGQPFVGYCQPETYRSGYLMLCFVALFAVALYLYLNDFRLLRTSALRGGLILGILTVLILYMYLPDGDGRGGFVSIRFCILLFILLGLFISTAPIRQGALVAIVSIAMYHQYRRVELYKKIIVDRNEAVTQIRKQAELMESNAFLYSFKGDDDWLSVHYYNYVCLDKPIVALQDYEALNRYFPLVFRDNQLITEVNEDLGAFRNLEAIHAMLGNRPVYLWVLGDSNHVEQQLPGLKKQLQEHASLLNSNNFASLYKLN